MRVTLLASAGFARPALDALLAGGHEVSVGTQPARPAGRGRSLRPTEIWSHAEELGLGARELEDVNDPDGLAWLTGTDPDLVVVVAFGQKLGPAVRAAAPCTARRGGCWGMGRCAGCLAAADESSQRRSLGAKVDSYHEGHEEHEGRE